MQLSQPPAIRQALFDERDWSLSDLICWLAAEGRRLDTLDAFAPALCERLLAAGAPVWRVMIGARTLHPQASARACVWTRGEAVQCFPVPHTEMEGPDYHGSPIDTVLRSGQALRKRLDQLDSDRDHSVFFELRDKGASDYLALPLRYANDADVGAIFFLCTDSPKGFSDADLNKFAALAEFIAPILEALTGTYIARALLDTYLGPRSGQRVLAGHIGRGDGELISAAIWISDLRDSTRLSEQLPLAELLDALNDYYELIETAIKPHGGEILSFIGDAVLAVFSDSKPDTDSSALCEAALDAADDALAAQQRRSQRGETALDFGIGLHYGDVVYGNVGTAERLEFTVMGPAVNRAARLEALTRPLAEKVLLSAEFASRVKRPLRTLGEHPMKGFEGPQPVIAPVSTNSG